MKCFWSSRDGKPPPEKSTFHLKSFDLKVCHSGDAEWITLPKPKSYKVLSRSFSHTYEAWERGVEKALHCIHKKEIEKVVLGRFCFLELGEEPDPFAIAAALKRDVQGAFIFCVQVEGMSFLGATPERLFYRHEGQLLTEAVAGTVPCGMAFTNPKFMREFLPVQRHLEKTLFSFCTSLAFSPISVHRTANVAHLYSKAEATLKEGANLSEMLAQLHPTPALCGAPQGEAMALLRELEPFEREFFCGVTGWETAHESEMAVALRSCKIEGKRVTLFSGAGIVEGSDPKEEWEELNQKLKLYDRILVD